MNKAEKIWSMDSEKMRIFLLREIEETGSEWEALIKQHINGCQKGKILDVGCGTGFISLIFAKIGCEVIAIDNNIAMLKAAAKISEELGFLNKITFMLKDAESMDFTDNTFDTVVSRHAFWLFNNPKKSLWRVVQNFEIQRLYVELGRQLAFPFLGRGTSKALPVR